MTDGPHPREDCYFCDEADDVLEDHHVVPRRFNGADHENNLVTVCPTCHEKLEGLYGERFYRALGVGETSDIVQYAARDIAKRLEELSEEVALEIGDTAGEIRADYGSDFDAQDIARKIAERRAEGGEKGEEWDTADLGVQVGRIGENLEQGRHKDGAEREQLIQIAVDELGCTRDEAQSAIERLHRQGRIYENPTDYLHFV